MPSSRGSPHPGIKLMSPEAGALQMDFFFTVLSFKYMQFQSKKSIV